MISRMKMSRRAVFQSGSARAARAHGVLPTFVLALLGTSNRSAIGTETVRRTFCSRMLVSSATSSPRSQAQRYG